MIRHALNFPAHAIGVASAWTACNYHRHSHTKYMVSAVNVDYFACNSARKRTDQEEAGVSDFIGLHGFAQGCTLCVKFDHAGNSADGRGGKRLDETGRDRIDADALRPEVTRQVS